MLQAQSDSWFTFEGGFKKKWPNHLRIDSNHAISNEMAGTFPYRGCVRHLAHFLAGKRLQFWCDHETVDGIINSGHSKAKLG